MQEQTAKGIAALRMRRQYLDRPADEAEYEALFRRMSPVRCLYWSEPGLPPTLRPRAGFDDMRHCFALRARRELVKGRFQGGGIGYIFADEWPLFISAYRRSGIAVSEREQELLHLLEHEGPLTIGVMRELSGLRAKDITPALHKLQEKFLVFEEQSDNDWERSWHLFPQVFPDMEKELTGRQEAISRLLLRFAYLNVWIDERMAASYYRFALRDLKPAFAALLREGKLLPLDGGYLLPEDRALLEGASGGREDAAAAPRILALHRNDYLVKSQEHLLSGRFAREGMEVLWYLLTDGEIQGAVLGRFHNGPYELLDVIFELPEKEAQARRGEVMAAIERVSDPAVSPLRCYQGVPL